MRPMCCDFGSMGPDHVRPASVDLYTPAPHDELRMLLASPVPTQTTSGFDGATSTAPTVPARTESKTGVQVTPAFVVFQTPPVAAPAYTMFPVRPPRDSTPAMSVMRPLTAAGP